MTRITIEEANELAQQRCREGRLADAEMICRQILAQQAEHAGATELLARLGELHFELANSLQMSGRMEDAIASYHQAIRLQPGLAAAHNNLGAALGHLGRMDEAIASHQRAVIIKPDYADAYYNLGIALKAAGRPDEAANAYRGAIAANREHAAAHNNLGNVLKELGRLDEAISAYERAMQLKADYSDARTNLGIAYLEKGRLEESAAVCREIVGIRPTDAEAHFNLGVVLQRAEQTDEAVVAYRRSLALKSDHVAALNNLANILKNIGQIEDAIALYRQAMMLRPDDALLHSNLIMAMHFLPQYDGRTIRDEANRWNQRHAEPLKRFARPHDNNRGVGRRLRVGLLSPDFYGHVVGMNLLPLLRAYDRGQVEMFCYSDASRSDELSERIRRQADGWRDLRGTPDARAAEMIREDGIDILVDLALHSGGNRLRVFAYKPAPVQATWLGYAGTTGLAAMDYRLSDPHIDPPETDLSHYSERTVRLPVSYWCYQPSGDAPEINAAPCRENGHVTFGCLNNFAKVSDVAMRLWARVLAATPKSRLLIHCREGAHRTRVLERLEAAGMTPDRVEMVGLQSISQYMRTYQRIDVALDPFPYGGGITTCDALWMGVPVISLSGALAVGRGGRSILTNAGLPELVAYSEDQYVHLAAQAVKWTEMRPGIRPGMTDSPLMDAKRFARDMESAFRWMWNKRND